MPRTGGVPAILAEAGEPEVVIPLSKLDRLFGERGRMAAPYRRGARPGGFHIENYHAVERSDPRHTAAALMLLDKARG
jgi:hypothetical protein